MSEAKFRYEIHPRIPMRNVLDKAIIKPTTVELTLDQVKECLKYGPVYRRFNADHIEKVTLFTIDALHQEKFDPEAVANSKVAKEPPAPKKVTIKFKEEPKPQPITEEKKEESASAVEESKAEEPTVEEVKEEAPVVEEVKEAEPIEEKAEEVAPTEEKVEEKVEDTAPEAPSEAPVEEEKVVESSEEENVTEVTDEEEDDVEAPKANNGGKKKKHH